MTIKTPITRTAAKADQVEIVRLYEMTMKGRAPVRFTPDAPQGLSFGGKRYDAFAGSVSGLVYEPSGVGQQPQVRLSNANGLYYDDLFLGRIQGQQFTRIVTFSEECDAPIGNGGGSSFTPETWKIDRIHSVDAYEAVLDLVPEADIHKASLPMRVMLRDLCQHRYRIWDEAKKSFDYEGVTCPYVGQASFDDEGNVAAAAHDECSLKLESGCKKRFSGTLPFLGFPGIGGV